ncbi:nucleoside recognition domain-containing protein [Botrimarina sp.]|uniref:spore maturation protein n=1 Tax=Botrimarina sp. TaxID=2795802 RepID=UPI0032ED489A
MIDVFRAVLDAVSQWSIPGLMLLIVLWGRAKGVPMYSAFVTGAKEGFNVAVMIIPYLVAILVVVKVFTASGIFEDIKTVAAWGLSTVGAEEAAEGLELLPLALIRPLSGGGARGVLVEIFDTHGPDSLLGQIASLMMGSTETTFYVIAVYYGAVQVRNSRHTLPACLAADAAGAIAAVLVGLLLFA